MPVKDKALQASYSAKHYLINKEEIKARAIAFKIFARKRNKEFVDRVKRRYPCRHCGFNNPLALEFHHLSDKIESVAKLVNSACSLEMIKDEIRKCVILCANCHRIETLTQVSSNGGSSVS